MQQQLRDPGDLRGPQLQADRAKGEAERAAQPLGIADAERGEQAGYQEVAQVSPGDRVDYPAEDVGVPTRVVVGRAGLGHQRGGKEVAGRIPGMIGIVFWPAVAVPSRHAEQVPHSNRLAARRRRAGQSGQVRQYGIVQAERTLALEQADRQ